MLKTTPPDRNEIYNRINSEKTKFNLDKPQKKTFWGRINNGLNSFNNFMSDISNALKTLNNSLNEERKKLCIEKLKLMLTAVETLSGSLITDFQNIKKYKEFIEVFDEYVKLNKFSNTTDIEIDIINELKFDYAQYKEVIQSFKATNNEYYKVLNDLGEKEIKINHLDNQYNTYIEQIKTYNILFKLESNSIKNLVELLESNSEIVEIENKSFILEVFNVILKNPENHKLIRLSQKNKFDSLIVNDKLFYTNELEEINNKYDYIILDLQNKIEVFKNNKILQYLGSINDRNYFNKLSLEIQYLLDSSNKVNKKNIISYPDTEIQKLKVELKSLENILQKLTEQKNEYLNDIEEFNTLYNIHLGELLKDILNLKKELLYKQTIKQQEKRKKYEDDIEIFNSTKENIEEIRQTIEEFEKVLEDIDEDDENYNEIFSSYKELQDELEKLEKEILEQQEKFSKIKEELEDDEIFKEYEESKKQYEQFHQNYEDIKQQQSDIFDITNEQKSELKKLWKKACKLCHPDIVIDKFKEKAHEVMQSLNDAYSKKDIVKVQKILSNLENGLGFEIESDNINDKEILKSKINEYKKNILELESEIENLKQDETYQIIQEIDDMDEYFKVLKVELQSEKDRLENDVKEILENTEENNVEQTQKVKYQEDIQTFQDTKEIIDELRTTILELKEVLDSIDEDDENYEEFSKAYNELKGELEKLEAEYFEEIKSKLEDEVKDVFEENIKPEDSPYAKHIQSIENIKFEKIRKYCENLSKENEADAMQRHLGEQGKMYKALMYSTLEVFLEKLGGEIITLCDWGCGQGIASMLVLDYIKEKQLDIKVSDVILIDDDTKALGRAMIQGEALAQNSIKFIPIKSDDNNISDTIKSNKNNIVLNLFANDKIPKSFWTVDYDIFDESYFLCVSNENKEFVDEIYENINSFINVQDLSILDGKIGRFDKYERIFKIKNQ